jgi:peptidyl-prolyl cis-trans isomerase B (cyclophilin B)
MTYLAKQKYFDNTQCHRLTTSGIFVLQCGDPKGNGTGGPGFSFADENLPTGANGVYKAGTVAMANSGPNTNGSQFFLVYKDSPLPANYSVWGTVTGGMDILTGIADAGVANGTGDGAPAQKVVISKATTS